MQKSITSPHNPLIKQISLLQEKSRERRKTGLFVIEGLREISLALKGNYSFKIILFCSKIISEVEISELRKSTNAETEFIEIPIEIYEKLAYRGSTEGILAIAFAKDLSISNLPLDSARGPGLGSAGGPALGSARGPDLGSARETGLGSARETGLRSARGPGLGSARETGLGSARQPTILNPLILIAEAPEKPGNIGAILRTADAANVDAVIIANPKTDMYNPNIIRSSVGTLFTNQVVTGNTSEIIAFLKKNNINIYCAALQASVPYHTMDFKEPSAIVVGTEATGLSQEWLDNSTQNIIIPMSGEIDSMNVSVAAGILIFEAKRQRGVY